MQYMNSIFGFNFLSGEQLKQFIQPLHKVYREYSHNNLQLLSFPSHRQLLPTTTKCPQRLLLTSSYKKIPL